MSTATYTSSAHTSAGLSYTENLGRAARAFLAALLAVTPGVKAAPAAKSKRDVGSVAELYRLAGGYDSIQPSLAQELRALASVDRD
ncbi:hypothetical protein [Noviherbaspirillum saxi]|uniref:Uncharacterized protein n=1 Tax=Noviherbaspirillum saxi TaxID=2320863 RepID=A0A3A3FYQ8_9BURK|nr:hypothetical protein [Noviherbaspirillum saxi]RJF99341.1 hypothetical protein D3871_13025 [Noviherbaspirillum saxi]